MIHLVTYADEKMTRAQELCVQSSLKYEVDNALAYSRKFMGMDFYHFNGNILSQERGAGYWLWKPYFIEYVMRDLNDGDILIYADAGVEFIGPVREIISRMDEDIFFFSNGWPHVEWCKADVMHAIDLFNWRDAQGNWWDDVKDEKQIQASVIFFKVNQKTRDFVKEWLLWCQMPGFIDDSPSKISNYPTFAEHRHDQAILTCLAIKHGYTIDHWWPTQYSMHLPKSERDSYPVMFNHHRKRNSEW
jgi:hypothetical protein